MIDSKCPFVNSYSLWKGGVTIPCDKEDYRIIMLEGD